MLYFPFAKRIISVFEVVVTCNQLRQHFSNDKKEEMRSAKRKSYFR